MVGDGNLDAVLIDFGLARGFVPDRSQQVTVGVTHGFAPPEQYIDFGRFSESTDVCALAATLYYLLTKTPPTAAFLRALNYPLKPLVEINSRISDGVRSAIMQCHQKYIKLPFSIISTSPKVGIPAAPPQLPLSQPVKLISAKGIDYRQLDRLLAGGKWKAADPETVYRMLEVAGKQEEGWLTVEDVAELPCEELRAIDRLWVKYSNGRFGFSVHKRIYQSLGGTNEYDNQVWQRFGDAVGWRKTGNGCTVATSLFHRRTSS